MLAGKLAIWTLGLLTSLAIAQNVLTTTECSVREITYTETSTLAFTFVQTSTSVQTITVTANSYLNPTARVSDAAVSASYTYVPVVTVHHTIVDTVWETVTSNAIVSAPISTISVKSSHDSTTTVTVTATSTVTPRTVTSTVTTAQIEASVPNAFSTPALPMPVSSFASRPGGYNFSTTEHSAYSSKTVDTTCYSRNITNALSHLSQTFTTRPLNLSSTTIPTEMTAMTPATSTVSSYSLSSVTIAPIPFPLTFPSSLIASMAGATSSPTQATTTLTRNITSTSIVVATTTLSNTVSTPSATSCGVLGDMMLGWDDQPYYSPSDNASAPIPPVFNPYDHFIFSNGFGYVPPPNDPFLPVSQPRLAIFQPNESTQDDGSPYAAGMRPGEIGAGPLRWPDSAFWFNVTSVYLGCKNAGPNPCSWDVWGFGYNAVNSSEERVARAQFQTPACPGLANCTLSRIDFSASFVRLSGIQFAASVSNSSIPVDFYMDNLRMGWWNNSCAAGLERAYTH